MSTEITTSTAANPLAGMNAANGIFTTVKGDDFETKAKIFNAVNDAKPVSDLSGKPFEIADLVIESTEFVNEKTGEIEPAALPICRADHLHHALWRRLPGILRADLQRCQAYPHPAGRALSVARSAQGAGD